MRIVRLVVDGINVIPLLREGDSSNTPAKGRKMLPTDENGRVAIPPWLLIDLALAVAREYGRGPEVSRPYVEGFLAGYLASAREHD